MAKDVPGYLAEQQRKCSGELAQEWATLEEYYTKRLWHQLTLKMQTFVKNPVFAQGDGLVKLYHNFISDFEHRISPIALVQIAVYIARAMKDPKEALDFWESLKEKVKSSDESTLLVMTSQGNIHLNQKNMDQVKAIITEAEKVLDAIDGITAVHGSFYDMSSRYHKLMGNHADYYTHALRFLGCTELSDIPVSEQKDSAFNLGLAAILGTGVYNFGELLAHPLLDVLKGGDKQWLVDLLYAFNSGNIRKFEELKPKWVKQADLQPREAIIREKISLLCLMEMTFKRPATDRTLTFQEIAEATGLPLNEVELLIMKALSLDLVRGLIDQVDAQVHMTWVQPRVLDKDQISTMQKKLKQWCLDVNSIEQLVEVKAEDILT
ncbi:hypothetical protein NP493_1108g00022 [Ridgeia piscesae]|uniref:26S proteasome non-ATPase regulatory subunit 13 n=1 Tax=Ridgeia piscesae TaxID=27915 RepID=A0AAD9NI12_RIDPI|nr:hypothetical protein NP493_1108g00022 [Ridgeia piscesae]